MPTIPCDECDASFKNMVQLKNHKLSGECRGQAAAIAAAHADPEQAAYKFDFFGEGKPADPMKDVWKSPGVEGAHHSAGGLGSLGVFFLNLKEKAGVVVLKQGSPSTATEAFCSRLYRDLGVTVPTVRVLSLPEWTELLNSLRTVSFTESGAGDTLQDTRARKAGGTLQTFVRGYTLKDPRTKALFEGADAGHVMRQFGAMIAVDVLLNNFDRSPLVWDHQGNANNFMFMRQPDGFCLVAIDNTTQAITNPDGMEAYLKKVRAAVAEAVKEKGNGPSITKVRTFIHQWAGVDIEEEGCKEILAGFLETCRKIADYKKLTSVWEGIFGTFAGVGWGEAGMASIDLGFIQRVQETIAESLAAA